jgi:hypothetical protein
VEGKNLVYFKVYLGIRLDGLRETAITSKRMSPGPDSKSVLLKYAKSVTVRVTERSLPSQYKRKQKTRRIPELGIPDLSAYAI